MARRGEAGMAAGSMRSRILEASMALLEEQGVAGLSMREVARRAGVSHQAPYHEFPDRESILAALVADGFDDLAKRLRTALDAIPARDSAEAIRSGGLAYVEFALARPGIFAVMFRREMVDHGRFPAVLEAGRRAYAELERVAEITGVRGSSEQRAAVLWSFVHGLATLLVEGKLTASDSAPARRIATAAELIRVYAETAAGSPAAAPKAGRRGGRKAARDG